MLIPLHQVKNVSAAGAAPPNACGPEKTRR